MSRIPIATFLYHDSECLIVPTKGLINEWNVPIFKEFKIKEIMGIIFIMVTLQTSWMFKIIVYFMRIRQH